jgi:hypothetical protein
MMTNASLRRRAEDWRQIGALAARLIELADRLDQGGAVSWQIQAMTQRVDTYIRHAQEDAVRRRFMHKEQAA